MLQLRSMAFVADSRKMVNAPKETNVRLTISKTITRGNHHPNPNPDRVILGKVPHLRTNPEEILFRNEVIHPVGKRIDQDVGIGIKLGNVIDQIAIFGMVLCAFGGNRASAN